VSWRDPGVSLTTEDGSYFGNVVEPDWAEVVWEGDTADEDAGVLVEIVGEVVNGDVLVLVGVVLLPHPATSPTARMVTTSNPASPNPRIFFTGIPPYYRASPKQANQGIAFALRLCAWLYACCAGDSPHPMASTGTSIATTRSNTNRDRARDMEILPSAIYIF